MVHNYLKRTLANRIICVGAAVFFIINILPSLPALAAEEPAVSTPTYNNSIGGVLWLDTLQDSEQLVAKFNGVYNAGEPPVEGYAVSLFYESDTETPVQTTSTNVSGEYRFSNLQPGTYVVGIQSSSLNGIEYLVPVVGVTQDNKFVQALENTFRAFSAAITVTDTDEITGISGGLRALSADAGSQNSTAGTGSIGGALWLDQNTDGIFNSGEIAISEYPVYLYSATNMESYLQQTTTGTNGAYSFNALSAGTYVVGVKAQENGTQYLLPLVGIVGDNKFELDTSTYTQAFTQNITLAENEAVSGIHAAMRETPQVMLLATVVDDGAGIIVTTEAEFRTALANSQYATIYLGADITMTSAFTTVALRSNGTGLVIDGISPNDAAMGKHTYTGWTSDDSFQGTETSITFRNLNVDIRNYYGIYRRTGGSTSFTVTMENVTGVASQYFYGNGGGTNGGTLVIRNSALVITTNYLTGELAEKAGEVRFEGVVSISKENTDHGVFWDIGKITIASGASATITRTAGAYNTSRSIFYNSTALTVEENASLSVFSSRGFVDTGTLSAITLGSNATAKFIYTGTDSYSGAYLYASSVTIGDSASFLIYDNQTNAAYGALRVGTLTLNNPKQFVVLNQSSNAIGTGSTSLIATNIGSIGYQYSGTISNVYNATSYEYTGSEANHSKWWAQNQLFAVSATTWSGTNPTITSSSYASGNVPSVVPAPETTLTGGASGNFALNKSGQAAYGVIIKGLHPTTLTISNTTEGAYADLTKDFSFTVYFFDSGGNSLAAGTTFAYTGGASSGSGATAPANGTLTLDASGAASFVLKHGQLISISGIGAGSQIRVVQTIAANYTVAFKDSDDTSSTTGADTGIRSISGTSKTFDFTNTRISVVPTGVSAGGNGAFIFLIVLFSAVAAGFIAKVILRRFKEGRYA